MARIKSRDEALRNLVPKVLGIISERGQKLHGLSGRSVRIGEQVELSGSRLDGSRIMLSVYSQLGDRIPKVFSAHVTDMPSAGDPAYYRYLEGTVMIMSWRRGEWEDVVLADPAAAKSTSETLRSLLAAQLN